MICVYLVIDGGTELFVNIKKSCKKMQFVYSFWNLILFQTDWLKIKYMLLCKLLNVIISKFGGKFVYKCPPLHSTALYIFMLWFYFNHKTKTTVQCSKVIEEHFNSKPS